MPLIDANGLRLHALELGAGPPVAMLHGLLVGNLATWYLTAAPAVALELAQAARAELPEAALVFIKQRARRAAQRAAVNGAAASRLTSRVRTSRSGMREQTGSGRNRIMRMLGGPIGQEVADGKGEGGEREGDAVAEGQMLARMDMRELEAELRQTQAQVTQAQKQRSAAAAVIEQRNSEVTLAQKNLARSRELYENRNIPIEQLQRSRPGIVHVFDEMVRTMPDGVYLNEVKQIGRRLEIQRVMQILSRRTKNNPVLLGEAGVGKTAIVEGLAQRIVTGNVPDALTGRGQRVSRRSLPVSPAPFPRHKKTRLSAGLQALDLDLDGVTIGSALRATGLAMRP